MAKKKKTSSSRATKKPSKKKAPRKKSAPTKAPAKKAPAKKAPAKKATRARSSGSSTKSVDGVLKKYEKERAAQESQLATLKKKIEDLEAKTRAYQEQIVKLTGQANTTEDAIALLDTRRDEEVGSMLSKLGVQLGGGAVSPSEETAVEDDLSETEPDDHGSGDEASAESDEDADSTEESGDDPSDE